MGEGVSGERDSEGIRVVTSTSLPAHDNQLVLVVMRTMCQALVKTEKDKNQRGQPTYIVHNKYTCHAKGEHVITRMKTQKLRMSTGKRWV